MQALRIKKWGNSQGIRIPRQILELVGLSEEDIVEVEVIDGKLILSKPEKELKAFGALSQYAVNGSIEQEKGAWEREVVKKYEAD